MISRRNFQISKNSLKQIKSLSNYSLFANFRQATTAKTLGKTYCGIGSYSNDGDVSVNHGETDYWIVKLNIEGDLVWQKSLGGSGYDSAYSVQQTSDGGYINIAGQSGSKDGDVSGRDGSVDFWIVKLKPESY